MKAFISYLIMSLFFVQIQALNNRNNKFLSHSSYITVKINKSGNQSIYFGRLYQADEINILIRPDEVYINGAKKDEIKSIYEFDKKNNTIKLLWNNKINSCSGMFIVFLN